MNQHATFLAVSYDAKLVVLSIAIAAVAAYVALTFAERIIASSGRARYAWLGGGAIALGGGIWAMHFTGMLALRMPITVQYDVPLVGFSLLAAVVSAMIALLVVTQPAMISGTWLIGGVLMGASIAAMHYLGMAAMRMCALIRWDIPLVGLSIIVAVAGSLVALRLVFALRDKPSGNYTWGRAGAAVLMGIAIAGMHYTAMAGAHFVAQPDLIVRGLLMSQAAIDGGAMLASALFMLTAVSVVAIVDRHVSGQQHLIAQQQRYLQTILSTAPVIFLALDAQGNIVVAQGRDLPVLGQFAESMVGRPFREIFAGQPLLLDQAERALAGESHSADIVMHDVALDIRWIAIRDASDRTISVIAVALDITERRNAERAMRHQTLNDPLTSLPNRTAMHERLTDMLRNAEEWGRDFALALIDLDRFKEVNDTLGHAIGDELLTSVARRIDAAMGAAGVIDAAFRIGGDEFVLFLPGMDALGAGDIARELLAELARPHEIAGYTLDVRASMGLATYPAHALDGQTLLRCADVAMYVAKNAGLGFAVYDSAHDRHSKTLLALEADMRHAIQHGGFELYYQPQLDMTTGRVHAAEALLRWNHPTLGLLPPDRFIPLAEETGLIVPLTDWVIENALQQTARWSQAGIRLQVAVNVSMRGLREEVFPQTVSALLERYGVPPEQLVIEVTETIIMIDDERSRSAFERLAALGTELSIDDFGTGYSSLAYLRRLPVTELKIDKTFVFGLAQADSKDAELVRLVIDLGHNLGLRVVAEGVENQDVLDTLAALGCDVAQGYFVSRPIPAATFEKWIRAKQTTTLSIA